MTVYVDEAKWPYRGTFYCHMMTDGNLEELHAMAGRLGLKRGWFQNKASGPHYDLSQNKRWQAIRLGAVAVSSREMLRKCSPRMAAIMDGTPDASS